MLGDLKNEGHILIEEIHKITRIPKNAIYLDLALRLNILPQEAHFGNMKTEHEILKAISALNKMKRYATPYKPTKREKAKTKEKWLPQKEMDKAVAKVTKLNKQRRENSRRRTTIVGAISKFLGLHYRK